MPASALSVSWVASASVRADLDEVSAGGVDLSAGVEAVSSPPLRDLSAPSSHVEGDPAVGLLVVEGDRVEPAVGDATLFDELDRGPVGRKRVAPGGEDNGARRQVAGTGAAGRTGSWRAEGCVRCSMIAR